MTEPITYTTVTAAAATGLSKDLIERAIRAGELKAKRTGKTNDEGKQTGRYLITRGALDDWIDSLEDVVA